jgi:hypothetical protein
VRIRCPQLHTREGLSLNLSGNSISREVVGEWLWSGCRLEALRVSGGYTLRVRELRGEPGRDGDPAAAVLDLAHEDLGPLEQVALAQLLKFNNACVELNGIVFDEEMASVDLSFAPLDLSVRAWGRAGSLDVQATS